MDWYLNADSNTAYYGDKRPGSNDQTIPNPPSVDHRWDSNLNNWAEKYRPPQWDDLYQALRNSAPFQRTYGTAKGNANLNISQANKTRAVVNAFAAVQAKLASNRQMNLTAARHAEEVADLQFFFTELRTAMQDLNNDFSTEEVTYINNALSTNHFPFQI